MTRNGADSESDDEADPAVTEAEVTIDDGRGYRMLEINKTGEITNDED